jgi:hypothetical protein
MAKKFNKNDFFKQICGTWEGKAKTYFKPNELADESTIRGTIRELLDGLFLLHEYEGTLMGEKMLGLAIYGYNENKDQFEIAWINNAHMGSEIMLSTGKNTDGEFLVNSEYEAGGEIWGWKTILELIEPNNLIIRHFNITPKGQEYLGVEIEYNRSK